MGVAATITTALTVPIALLAPHKPPAITVRNVAQLLHIDMDQRSGVGVFVAADWFTGGPIDMAQPVQPGAGQDPMNRRRCDTGSGRELDGPFS